MSSESAKTPQRGWLEALLLQLCPRCRQGAMFRGTFAMNDPCPECGLIFQREEGYFLGAMYASSALSSLSMATLYFLLSALLTGVSGVVVAVLALVLFLPLIPVIFRYSRVLWVHFERTACPQDVSATGYEKERQRRDLLQEGINRPT